MLLYLKVTVVLHTVRRQAAWRQVVVCGARGGGPSHALIDVVAPAVAVREVGRGAVSFLQLHLRVIDEEAVLNGRGQHIIYVGRVLGVHLVSMVMKIS